MSKQNDRLFSYEIILQGVGGLTSWNAILSALDWYNNSFPNKDPGFWLPLLNFIPAVIFQPLTIMYGHHFTYNKRIVTSYVSNAIILALTPLIVTLCSEDTGFVIICILTVIGGAFIAIGQPSTFSLTGTLPDKYTNGVMFGNGISGLIVTCLRLICLGIFPENSSGYLHSTMLYFGISGGILGVCVAAQIHLMKHPLVVEGLGKLHSKGGGGKNLIAPTEELDLSINSGGFHTKPKEKISYGELIKKIWQYFFLIWINYFITFGVLSHVALATQAR